MGCLPQKLGTRLDPLEYLPASTFGTAKSSGRIRGSRNLLQSAYWSSWLFGANVFRLKLCPYVLKKNYGFRFISPRPR